MPERMCVACRGRAEKGDLVRVVYAAGEFRLDAAQREPGRGAYLHLDCLGSPRGRHALPRALRVPGGASPRLGAGLREALAAAATPRPA